MKQEQRFRMRVCGWIIAIILSFLTSPVNCCAFLSHHYASTSSTGKTTSTSTSTTKRSTSVSTAVVKQGPSHRFPGKLKNGNHFPRSNNVAPLYARPQDNLVSGIAEISFAFSLGVLWSEYSIALTGCGPLNFSDTLERICYQGVIVASGVALFNRIVQGTSLDETTEELFGPLEDFTLWQVRIAEWSSVLSVLGAFVALAFQYSREINMDGLSGINVDMCRALREL
jgi:hypothetical protein